MSRSHKKFPRQKATVPWFKNYANRILRRMKDEDIPDGNAYRRYFDSYTINDFNLGWWSKQEWDNWHPYFDKGPWHREIMK